MEMRLYVPGSAQTWVLRMSELGAEVGRFIHASQHLYLTWYAYSPSTLVYRPCAFCSGLEKCCEAACGKGGQEASPNASENVGKEESHLP